MINIVDLPLIEVEKKVKSISMEVRDALSHAVAMSVSRTFVDSRSQNAIIDVVLEELGIEVEEEEEEGVE